MNRLHATGAIVVCVLLWSSSRIADKNMLIKYRGVCWVGGQNKISEQDLKRLANLNVNWISQTPFGWQRSATSPEIVMHTTSERIWWGESDEGISETTRMARDLDIKTMLKPHLWVGKGWPGDIQMNSNLDWELWFNSYEKFILHYAALAEANHIDILCIGTELGKTISREEEWRNLIRKIKTAYHGSVTYAANFHDEYESIAFWDELDYIGVQAYFSLSKNKDAPLKELEKGWSEPIAAIERVQSAFNKPVLFTELGYRSTHDAAVAPWEWPKQEDAAQACYEAQAACYQAFFDTVWNKKWLAGVYFWKWYPQGPHRLGSIDFTPQNKLAERVLFENFSK